MEDRAYTAATVREIEESEISRTGGALLPGEAVGTFAIMADVRARSYTRCMARKADEVYLAGLELDVDERTVVAHRLLASLHPDDDASPPDIDAAWRDEIGSRVDDILNDRVELGTFEQTRTKARALLDDLSN